MLNKEQFDKHLEELKAEGMKLDIREKIVVGYLDGSFVFTANKVGEFWYPRRQSSLL